jgi:hypothetical protein
MKRRNNLGRGNLALSKPRHVVERGLAAGKQGMIGTMVAASYCRGDANHQRLLGHLQAENAELRNTAVRLALEIQHLRRLAR